MKEIWKDILGYEGLYQVSNYGRIKSFNYRNTGKEKMLSLKPNKNGYIRIGLTKDGKRKMFQVHQLVAQTFLENPNNYSQINHKDENKINNNAENLEWCTPKYNSNYGTRNERASKTLSTNIKGKHKGKLNPNAKKVVCITTGEMFDCIKHASEKFNTTYSNIIACCTGKTKTAGKHPVTGEKLVWRYLKNEK